MRKMIIALAALALCGVAIAFGGPYITNAWGAGVLFTKSNQHSGHGGPGSPSSGFTSASTGINSNGWVYVTFKDDLSSYVGQSIGYTFNAGGAANWVCATGGGGKGKNQAAGATTLVPYATYSTTEYLTVPNNGVVSGGAAIAPPGPPTTACAGTWELGAVSYLLSTGSLTDSVGNVADDVMSGACSIGTPCSQVFISGVSAPTVP